jgi:hypothetical protein
MYSQGLVEVPAGNQFCCIPTPDLHGWNIVKPAPEQHTAAHAGNASSDLQETEYIAEKDTWDGRN